MPVIRASEIGNFLYCQRAWWYRQQGVESENQLELTAGLQIHRLHGLAVLAANIATIAGYILILISLAIFIYIAAATIIN